MIKLFLKWLIQLIVDVAHFASIAHFVAVANVARFIAVIRVVVTSIFKCYAVQFCISRVAAKKQKIELKINAIKPFHQSWFYWVFLL